MKRILTATAVALVLGTQAFAMTPANDRLHDSVQNSLRQIAPSVQIPEMSNQKLAKLRTILSDTSDNNTEKRAKVNFFLSKN